MSGEATWGTALTKAGCYDFLVPVADKSLAQACKRSPEGAALLSAAARADLQDICLRRLGIVYERSLVRLAARRVRPSTTFLLNAGGRAKAQALANIAQELSDEVAKDGGASLRASLPYAHAYEQAIAVNLGDALAEFLSRLASRCESVSAELLEGRPITRVEGLSASDADPHRHGRMVMRVETDAGCFYYKPHDCTLDACYLALVGSWFADCAQAARLVQGEGYAFAERHVPKELACADELPTYWHNLGCLTALFHGLGSRDMTCDNLMCCGTRPAALDLETLLVGEMPFTESAVAGSPVLPDLSPQALANSVACTAVLPLGVGGVRYSPLTTDNASGTCLPHLGGDARSVTGFERDFSAGFERGYRRLMCNREEILAVLGRHETASCRQVLLNTRAYVEARMLLFDPSALSDGSKRDEVLARLNKAYAAFSPELRKRVAQADARALTEGDIPYFCSKACSRMLYDADGNALGELLAQSALEVARGRLMRLSEDELRFELDLIQRCLA
ncbi:MAG: DUF4135 domain-containing protein [Coriobacteriales bacterium]|nr:DUF4135 domain-containing protein [Coriobacteriales bacterium]